MKFDAAHMTSLFENATEGIILVNKEAQIVLANPSAARIFGYDIDQMGNLPIEELIPFRFSHHAELRKNFYQNPANRVMGEGRDLFGRKKDGTDIPVEISLSHYKKDNDLYVIAFVVDITKRKEIEKSMLQQKNELEKITDKIRQLNASLEVKVEERTLILKEALQKLEQSQKELSEALDKERQLNEIKSRFVSMASHEFRTPLSTVLSSASLLAKYKTGEEQDKRDRHIQRIKNSVNHLNDILEDFLSLGKLNEGKVDKVQEVVSLREIIMDTMEEMKAILKKEQYFELCCETECNACTDKKLFRNVLINLLSNASKFSDTGKKIVVESGVKDGHVVVSVTDEGIGISEEDQDHLFSSFFRGANATNIQGTGLGLHIVKSYIDLLGGEVSLKSRLNVGTTVTFTVPLNLS
jgi:PAS domain S-box-containing protein